MEGQRLIRRKEVEKIVGLGRSCIYMRMRDGLFPRPVQIGGRCVAWKEADIQRWIDDRPVNGGIEP